MFGLLYTVLDTSQSSAPAANCPLQSPSCSFQSWQNEMLIFHLLNLICVVSQAPNE